MDLTGREMQIEGELNPPSRFKLYSPLRQHLQIPCDELTARRWTAIGRLNPPTYHTDSFI